MILIYSRDADSFVNKVIDYLEDDFIRVGDLEKIFIDNLNIGSKGIIIKLNGRFFNSIDFNRVKTVWFNGGKANTLGSKYENNSYSVLINTFLNKKETKKIGRLINSFEVNKLDVQLYAQEYGFKTPETLVTNDKNKLLDFYNRFDIKNGIICKRITDELFYENDKFEYDFTPTFLIDSNILKEIPKSFAISLFQERIVADFEVRVIFINGDFYSMSIHTFKDNVDYRQELDIAKNVRAIPFELPIDVKNKIDKIFKKLNLNYGSIDLMYSNDEFYFLEINPIGQIGFVNNICNFYIEEELSNILKNET